MESAKSRFLRYVTYYTTSDDFTGTSPSTFPSPKRSAPVLKATWATS